METKLHINDKIAKQKMGTRKNVQMKHANEKMRKITPDEKQSWNVAKRPNPTRRRRYFGIFEILYLSSTQFQVSYRSNEVKKVKF